MKTKFFSLVVTGALLITQFTTALAQTSSGNWSAVQAIAADERLIVRQKDGERIEGKMIEANDTNLTLSRNHKVVNISRDNIRQIEHVKGKAAKGKWALIGAGIGGATGAAIGATKVSADRDDSEIWLPVGLIYGAGAGAVGGLLFGASRRDRTVIYEVP
jgi:6-phosphogluconolactonase/glucosamine-6-phosphate isomerase/deaminase